jgi:histidyl-tRNA synthetase
MIVKAPRGMQDVLPADVGRWHRLEALMRDLARRSGYQEIRTPVVEHTEVFLRGVGSGTDIVDKEMYTFTDRGQRSLTLRAEGTAPVMRAFLEHNLGTAGLPVKVYYICPIFRYDRPQLGRFRQHTQFGAEVIGSPEPVADADVLSLGVRLVQDAGLRDVEVHLNSIGDATCRPGYFEALREYFRPHLEHLCEDCQGRFRTNPLRLLDCKRDQRIAHGAPSILAYLCDPCRAHFEGVQAHLAGMAIPFSLDPHIVRGLDYYTRTAAEVYSSKLGAQNSVLGGGRYDGLAEQLGGRPTPGVGFGLGMERLLLALEKEGPAPPSGPRLDVYIVTAGGDTVRALALADRLRRAGMAADVDTMARGLRAQMKQADRLEAAFVLVVGADEIQRGVVAVREMATGAQEEVALDVLPDVLARRLRSAAAGEGRG